MHLLTNWFLYIGIIVGMTLGVAFSPVSAMGDIALKGSQIIVALTLSLVVGFLIAGYRVINLASAFAAASQRMLQKLYRMSCFSSAFFVIMAGFWVYTIIALANFLDNFEVVYSLYLAIELIACLFLIRSLTITAPSSPSPQSSASSTSALTRSNKSSRASVNHEMKSQIPAGGDGHMLYPIMVLCEYEIKEIYINKKKYVAQKFNEKMGHFFIATVLVLHFSTALRL